MAVHHLASISWPAFRVLRSAKLVAVLPLGALEAHGPHLPLGTDIFIADAMAQSGAERLSRRGFDVVLLPALPVAPAPFAASFEGTIDTPPAATAAIIETVARSLGGHGVAATVIANAHHDPANVAAVREAVARVEEAATTRLIFPDLTRRQWASRLTDEFQSGACHAGRYETSVMLAVAAGTVNLAAAAGLAPNPQSLVAAIQRGDRTFVDAGGPDAYFGAPAEATAEEGRDIIDRLGAIIEDAVVTALGDHADR